MFIQIFFLFILNTAVWCIMLYLILVEQCRQFDVLVFCLIFIEFIGIPAQPSLNCCEY